MVGSFWAKLEVAALLLPADSGPARAAPLCARDLFAAISQAASGLTGAARSAAERARAGATRIEADVAAIDAELKSLSGGADPAEASRLAAKIGAMGPTHPSDGEAKRQMRELLDKQLVLLRGPAASIPVWRTPPPSKGVRPDLRLRPPQYRAGGLGYRTALSVATTFVSLFGPDVRSA